MRYKTLYLVISTAIGMMSASILKADHQFIELHAGQLECSMDELRDVFQDQFRDSGVYRELRSTAWDIRQGARQIERMARRNAAVCDIREAIENADRCLSRLHALVGEARYRAHTGIDPPLCGCTLHVDAKIALARQSLAYLRGALLGPVIVNPRTCGTVTSTGWNVGQPQIPGYVVPQAPVPGYPGSAPGWSPGNGSRNGNLPRGQYEETGRPLSGQGHGSGPALVNPDFNRQGNFRSTAGQPVGIYGQRENGIEMGNNGVVLRIGGAAIRF